MATPQRNIPQHFWLSICKLRPNDRNIACSAGILELAVVSSPPYWLEQSRWGGGVTSPFSLTPTPWDAFLSLSKPLPSLNPRWRSLDQTRILARQNTPALQANRNISTQHIPLVQHIACVWPPCCDVLRRVATCWVLLAQI